MSGSNRLLNNGNIAQAVVVLDQNGNVVTPTGSIPAQAGGTLRKLADGTIAQGIVLLDSDGNIINSFGGGGGGSGTVTSINIASSTLSVSGSPITTHGTIVLDVLNPSPWTVVSGSMIQYGTANQVGINTQPVQGALHLYQPGMQSALNSDGSFTSTPVYAQTIDQNIATLYQPNLGLGGPLLGFRSYNGANHWNSAYIMGVGDYGDTNGFGGGIWIGTKPADSNPASSPIPRLGITSDGRFGFGRLDLTSTATLQSYLAYFNGNIGTNGSLQVAQNTTANNIDIIAGSATGPVISSQTLNFYDYGTSTVNPLWSVGSNLDLTNLHLDIKQQDGTLISRLYQTGDVLFTSNLVVGIASITGQINGIPLDVIGNNVSQWGAATFRSSVAAISPIVVVGSYIGNTIAAIAGYTTAGGDGALDTPANLAINPQGGFVGVGSSVPLSAIWCNGTVNEWLAASFGIDDGTNDRVVMGNLSGHATLGAHNVALSDWADLYLNQGGGNLIFGSAGLLSTFNTDVTVDGTILTTQLTSTGQLETEGQLLISDAGGTLNVAGGTDSCIGTVTLASGTATVNTTAVKAGDLIFFVRITMGGILGEIQDYTIVDSISFTVTSTSLTETSTYGWFIVRPM